MYQQALEIHKGKEVVNREHVVGIERHETAGRQPLEKRSEKTRMCHIARMPWGIIDLVVVQFTRSSRRFCRDLGSPHLTKRAHAPKRNKRHHEMEQERMPFLSTRNACVTSSNSLNVT